MNRLPAQQAGSTLILALLLSLLIAASSCQPAYLAELAKARQQMLLASTLNQAREILLARAVNDSNRPGSLPCPDLLTDSPGLANVPGDGKADNLTRNDCPSYIGWLPWVTLDLALPLDEHNNRLWYVLAPSYRDDDNAPPLNAETTSGLSLDGGKEMVALIIAPGKAIDQQQRIGSNLVPSKRISDYLEGENANGDDLHYASGPSSDHFNDIVLGLSRDDLMAAVGKRVAGEVFRCLSRHANAPGNLTHRHAWPAPPGENAGRGHVGSHFGRIPLTQPSPGPSLMLAEAMTRQHWQDISGKTAQDQRQALLQLRENLGTVEAMIQHLFSTNQALYTEASSLLLQLNKLDNTIVQAEANGRISATERSTIRQLSASPLSAQQGLSLQLAATGMDVFPAELDERADALQQSQQSKDDVATQLRLSALNRLLAAASTPTPPIASALALAREEVEHAEQTLNVHLLSPNEQAVQAAIQDLLTAVADLQGEISRHRVNVPAVEIQGLRDMLIASFTPQADDGTRRTRLEESRQIIAGIRSASATINKAMTDSQEIISGLLAASALPPEMPPALDAALENLRAAIALEDHPLTQGSLDRVAGLYRDSQAIFLNYTAPTQAQMVPYAENLRSTAVDLAFWAEIIARHAAQTARLAKTDPNNTSTLPDSSQQAATSLAQSLEGSLKALDKLLANPASTTLRNAANQAIERSQSANQALIDRLEMLGASFSSGTAADFPVLWQAAQCAFLQDPMSWWHKNTWHSQVFFQIAQIEANGPARLNINGRSQYPLLILASGPPLAGQLRDPSRTSGYLEQENAHPSREGLAINPSLLFRESRRADDFNDQLFH